MLVTVLIGNLSIFEMIYWLNERVGLATLGDLTSRH